jgi:WD40 repeat protein
MIKKDVLLEARMRVTLKPHKILLTILVLAFVSGCAQQIATPTSSPTIDATPTLQPSKVPTNTATKLPTNTPTPDLSGLFNIQSFCPEISDDATSLSGLTGTMVLAENSGLVFRDAQSNEEIRYQLPNDQIYYYYVTSPDQLHIAVTEAKTFAKSSDVIVLTPDGQQETKFPLPGDWTLFGWMNNEKLLIRQTRLGVPGEPLELIALDVSTGQQEILAADFPEFHSREPFGDWGALTIFDPTGALVLYPHVEGEKVFSSLWDVNAKKELARLQLGSWPRWSPDGKSLLIVAEPGREVFRSFDEIFIMTLEGQVIRSSFFKDQFENDQIDLPAWSPNGRYIAFWLSTDLTINTSKLAIFDLETSTVDLYCQEINPFPSRFGLYEHLGYADWQVNAAPPIWSPDNQYVLVEDNQNFRSNTYLIDLKNHAITQIAENARAVGWLK